MAPPSLFARLWLAVRSFFRLVFDAEFAARVNGLDALPAFLPPKERPTLPSTPSAITAAQLIRNEQALNLISILQREGRLIDFCEQDLASLSDGQLAAAARSVHEGCRKALRDAVGLAAVRREATGVVVELAGGFDPRAIRLTGNVLGNPPFKGVLKHHGWRVVEIKLPPASGDPTLVAPAEIEIP